ncbi:hypothetical protein HHI36_002790 [Cryptolaemus montrouzieri]|uniref:Uncharacterized protein n=1 Tax=Cryptolaemus montrouzieri TaxID=559131 RepID=A0ABD2PCB9_9CUCU
MSENGKDREKLNSSLQKKNVLNSWKQNVLNKLSNNCQNESNEQSKVSDTNTAAEKSIDLTSATPKMKQLNPKSIAIKKQNSLDHGVAYYFKLMDKIGWDMSKSISSVSLEETSTSETIETQKASEPKKEVIDVNNDFEYSDSNSVSESNYITRRKRKRKHKRKPRVPTPIPGKLLNNNLCQRKLPIVPGTPKVHIRFDNEQKTLSSVHNNPITPKTIEEQEETSEPKETIKILQNVSITSSKIDSSIQGSQEDISTSNVPDIQTTELPYECSDTLYIKTELKNQTPETYSGDVQSTQTNTLDHTSENVNQLAYGDESSLFKSHFMNSNLSDDSLKFAKLSLLKELLNSKCAEDKSTINITIDSDDSFRNTKS